jgi:hypothetical protein
MKLTNDSGDHISTHVVSLFSFFGKILELGHASEHLWPVTDVFR